MIIVPELSFFRYPPAPFVDIGPAATTAKRRMRERERGGFGRVGKIRDKGLSVPASFRSSCVRVRACAAGLHECGERAISWANSPHPFRKKTHANSSLHLCLCAITHESSVWTLWYSNNTQRSTQPTQADRLQPTLLPLRHCPCFNPPVVSLFPQLFPTPLPLPRSLAAYLAYQLPHYPVSHCLPGSLITNNTAQSSQPHLRAS